MPLDNRRQLRSSHCSHCPPSTPRTEENLGARQWLDGPGVGGAQAGPSTQSPLLGPLSRKHLSVAISQITSRFQEQTCLLADMETCFRVPGLNLHDIFRIQS